MCDEIKKYGELKREWEIGHIKCIITKRMCPTCCSRHVYIMGCYVNEEGVRKERFLGYNFKMALDRVDIVKSSL